MLLKWGLGESAYVSYVEDTGMPRYRRFHWNIYESRARQSTIKIKEWLQINFLHYYYSYLW